MSQIELWKIEDEYFDRGVKLICGVDEAGRGPLAGPVCAAAVILPPHVELPGLNDSKKLTDKRRRELELNINEAKQQVSENVYSHLYFNGKCPIALPRTLLAKKQPAPSVVRPTTTKRLHDTEVWPSPIASFHPCLNPKDKSNI